MLFSKPSTRQIDAGLAILRVVIGAIFVAHGAQKLFVYGIDGVTGSFGQMGIPLAGVVAPLVALLEFAGGIALIAGALTRLVSLGLAVNMLGALFLVHWPAGFFLPNGYEFVLALLGAVSLFALTGAGAYSVDAVIGGHEARQAAAGTRAASARRAA